MEVSTDASDTGWGIYFQGQMHQGLWRTVSSTSMAYICREGGTVSRPLLRLSRQILLLALKRQVRILPVFLSSAENFLADAASRFQELPDWSLPEEAFHLIVQRWGLPEIDLRISNVDASSPLRLGQRSGRGSSGRSCADVEVSDRLRLSSSSRSYASYGRSRLHQASIS